MNIENHRFRIYDPEFDHVWGEADTLTAAAFIVEEVFTRTSTQLAVHPEGASAISWRLEILDRKLGAIIARLHYRPEVA